MGGKISCCSNEEQMAKPIPPNYRNKQTDTSASSGDNNKIDINEGIFERVMLMSD